jgi:hypothetical protein
VTRDDAYELVLEQASPGEESVSSQVLAMKRSADR